MKNPVMVASGTFGYGREFADLVDINTLGAIVVKGIRMTPWDGNPTPRLVEVTAGIVNAIGLQSPGVDGFISEYLPFLRRFDTPVIVNIWGGTIEEYGDVAAALDAVEGVHGLELNISCPNVKHGGSAFGAEPGMAARVVAAVRKRTRLPVVPKLAPNVPDIAAFVTAVESEGADAISLINSVPAMVIDIETRKPVLANRVGGLSGPAIHPIALKLVWEAARAATVPVIGIGGIEGPREAIAFLLAGASAVAVGTASFRDPMTANRVIDGIAEYLAAHGLRDVRDLVGTLEV